MNTSQKLFRTNTARQRYSKKKLFDAKTVSIGRKRYAKMSQKKDLISYSQIFGVLVIAMTDIIAGCLMMIGSVEMERGENDND